MTDHNEPSPTWTHRKDESIILEEENPKELKVPLIAT
jgi:hypothetical protein